MARIDLENVLLYNKSNKYLKIQIKTQAYYQFVSGRKRREHE